MDKALAIAQMVAECGGDSHPAPDEPSPASLFVVMQVVVEELGRVGDIMKGLERKG